MAQTTPDPSFGPFFVFVGLRWPSLAVIGLRGTRRCRCAVWSTPSSGVGATYQQRGTAVMGHLQG